MAKITLKSIGCGILACTIAGGITITTNRRLRDVNLEDISIDSLLGIEEIQNITLLDELQREDYLQQREDSLLKRVNQLEEYLKILQEVKFLDKKDYTELRPLSDDEYQTLNNSLFEVLRLKEEATFRGRNLKDQEKSLIAIKKLAYIKEQCENWVHQNGKEICMEFMLQTIKANVADDLDIPLNQFHTITIPVLSQPVFKRNMIYYIDVGNTSYPVTYGSMELWRTIDHLYQLNQSDVQGAEEIVALRTCLNDAKITLAAGSNLTNGKLKPQNDGFYIRKNFK